MPLSATQVKELEKPLDKSHVAARTQSGRTLSYIEGWHAIAEANRIFGFDGWQRETVDMREVRSPEFVKGSNGKETWRVGFVAKVRIRVGDIVREGTGYGSGALPELGEAYESAVKEAETDAMKRALMTFGNPFGLALYDKTQANVSDGAADAKAEESAAAVKALAAKIGALIDAASDSKTLDKIRATMDSKSSEELPDDTFNALAGKITKRREALSASCVKARVPPKFDEADPFQERAA